MVYKGLLLWMGCSFLLCNLRNGKLSINHNQQLYMILFALGCMAVMGFRSDAVGYDTVIYEYYYSIVVSTPISNILSNFYFQSLEFGFVLLMKICSYISSDYFFFQFIVSFLYCAGMARFLYRNAQNSIWSSFIFLGVGLFLLAFNVQRQMLAVMFVANSWSCFLDKKYVKTFLLLFLAVITHVTSLLFIGAYLIYLFRRNRIIYFVLIAGILLSIFYYDALISFIMKYSPIYNNYFNNTRDTLTAGFVKILWGIIVLLSVLILLKTDKTTAILRTYAIFSLFYVAANIIGMQFNYFERLGWFFLPFVVLAFDGFGSLIKNTILKNVYYIGSLLCFTAYFILSTGTEQYIYHIWL